MYTKGVKRSDSTRLHGGTLGYAELIAIKVSFGGTPPNLCLSVSCDNRIKC